MIELFMTKYIRIQVIIEYIPYMFSCIHLLYKYSSAVFLLNITALNLPQDVKGYAKKI